MESGILALLLTIAPRGDDHPAARVRNFLLIAPTFAPQATVAAYRWAKLSRHLPRLGFRPVVLAGLFPDEARDEGLLTALPGEVEVVQGYLDRRILAVRGAALALAARLPKKASAPRAIQGLVPSDSLLDKWSAHAVHGARSAVQLARSSGAEAVVVTAGPYSAVPVGIYVRRALGIPLVLDFRDPWGLHETGREAPSSAATRVRQRVIRELERRYFAEADHVILNTRRALAAYVEAFPEIEGKSSFIRNHFDMGLYADPGPQPAPPTRFTILHIGTLRAETTMDDIASALQILIERERLLPDDIGLRQIGRSSAYERGLMEEAGLSRYFEAIAPVPYSDVLRELRRSHVLLSMLHPRVDLRIAAKMYDYVASGMPIVAITTNPEVDELLVGRPDNARVMSGDIEGIVQALARRLAAWRASGRSLPAPAPPVPELSAETAASRMAAILERVLQ
jgi:glycosyltransferase involved in cell wall biosynthesis